MSELRLAIEQYGAGRLDAAEQSCKVALREAVGVDEASALNLLGMIAFQRGDNERAATLVGEAVRAAPGVADFHLNLGNIHGCRRRVRDALTCFDAALRLEPTCHEAYNGIGVTLATEGRVDEAEVAFRRAIDLKRDYAEAHNHLGAVLQAQGRIDDAIDALRESSRLCPEYAEAHFNLGMALLLKGDFAAGLPEYEWRRKQKRQPGSAPARRPLWDGSDPRGKTIVLYCEEGLGDMLQFIRYAAVLHERGAEVVVECPPAMTSLVRRAAGVASVIPAGSALPQHDCQAPVMSLPVVMNTTLQTIPCAVPYLAPDPALSASWRRQLSQIGGYGVGVCWQGSNDNAFLARHFPPAMLAALGSVKGVRLISLQKGPGAARAGELSTLVPLVEFPSLDTGAAAAFCDTAAVIANLDLVITCDTSIAHLAGALGASVWVLLPFAPDWRWLLGRSDSPWYPTIRLFRQPRRGDWGAVFAEVRAALQERVR